MRFALLAVAMLICLAFVAHTTPGKASETDNDAQVSLNDLPDFRHADYKAEPYIRAAATLQALGKDKAGATLLALAKDDQRGERIPILCRMLYTKKAGAEFRRPAIGAAVFLGKTTYSDWPLEPIELVDGVPFLITRGYFVCGHPEPATSYVRYCLQNCDWSCEQFKPKSNKEREKALEKLLASPKWKAQLTVGGKEFLTLQIK
jgi:hypothetical protein